MAEGEIPYLDNGKPVDLAYPLAFGVNQDGAARNILITFFSYPVNTVDLRTLDSTHLCTIASGTDLLDVPAIIFSEAEKLNIKVKYDTISLINHLRESKPKSYTARSLFVNVETYITPRAHPRQDDER